MSAGGIGERIRMWRRRRGISQAQLAGLVGRSESWLSQVERGVRSVDRLSVLSDMARILQCTVDDLSDRPWQFAPNGGPDVAAIAGLRRAFVRYDGLRGESPSPTMSAAVLRKRISDAHRDYQAAQYSSVLHDLPALMVEVDRMRQSHPDDGDIAFTAVSAYVLAAKIVTKLGVNDLSMMAADRAIYIAGPIDSLPALGMAGYQVACALLRADQPADAEDLALTLAARLRAATRPDTPLLTSLAGSLWLIAAVIAARQTNRQQAMTRLAEAQLMADLLGSDENYGWTAFGPTNVALHRVSVAAELGDAAEAVRLAADVDRDRLPTGLLSRRAQLHLDLAWAQTQRRNDAEATLYLQDVARLAPEVIRHNSLAAETVRELLARAPRARSTALNELAVRGGLLH